MDIDLARALHILGVVIWVGGVFMATVVILPTVRRGALGSDKLTAFQAVEHRFVWVARASVILVGFTGFYMVETLDLWWRFTEPVTYWWMHAMVIVWALFTLILFVGEPFVLRRFFPALVARDPDKAFALLHRVHIFLLAISLITIVGAMIGGHGGQMF